MSRDTITRFYAAFERLDGKAMQACYAPDASFEDEVFTLAGQRQVGGMWRMLCDATQAKGRDAWKLEVSDITDRSAHWDAHYRFSATGRLVLNRIDAEFEFTPGGLIRRHRDRFDFWRWSRQALGTPGLLLGWSPFLRGKVRAQAAANLALYLARPSPEVEAVAVAADQAA
ncbi:nuclear transport factor 2 family protein, partial [Ideonella sp. A 288]|uniref:nuclear transport factor 2 family protein n=1 Tax=Ideonella sp. A 288 TaxID=1962181 RepID=UPI0011862B4A